ncbi:hypothetical protein BYT27DRAFT_7253794 [Phlegmacium glaucopus]|nr:hypothetical protein BYT27DRAFT_7253794 [Phlegmacium glaucopus]
MARRGVSVSAVIANTSLPSTKIAMDIYYTLSNETIDQGSHDTVKELGQVENIDGIQVPLLDKRTLIDGVPVESNHFILFNLDSLRRRPSEITEARSRQRHLEASIYDLAVEMLQRRYKLWDKKDYIWALENLRVICDLHASNLRVT